MQTKRRGVESENEEISEIAKKKNQYHKKKNKGVKKGIVRRNRKHYGKQIKQEEKNKKRIRNGKYGKNIDI